MLFKKKKCPNCENTYDEMLDFCPCCKSENDGLTSFRRYCKVTFLPFYTQLILIGIALIGFLVANIMFSLIFNQIYQQDAVKGSMLINVCSYIIFFVAAVGVIFPYHKAFFIRFKSPWPFLIGLGGFFALITGEFVINFITSFIREPTTGGNQGAAESIITAYPVIAIIVLGIIGPICEELGYRVGLFSFLRRVHPALAYIATALIFGFIHFDISNPDLVNELLLFITYFWAGLCFSLVYEFGGISASITAHVINNLFSIIMVLIQGSIA